MRARLDIWSRNWRRVTLAATTAAVLALSGAKPAAANDYFAAALDPAELKYRETLSQFHTNKVPNLIREGRTKDALNELLYALERFPNHPVALLQLEVVGRLMKTPGLAEPYYQRALQLYPQYAVTYAQYGSYLVDLDKVDEGIAAIKQALSIDENLPFGHASMAKAYAKKGQMDLASQSATRARTLGYRGPLPEASAETKAR